MYCGFGTKRNKIRWTIVTCFGLGALACVVVGVFTHSQCIDDSQDVSVDTEFDLGASEDDDDGNISCKDAANRYRYECLKETPVCMTAVAVTLGCLIFLIAMSIPFCCMCCCAQPPAPKTVSGMPAFDDPNLPPFYEASIYSDPSQYRMPSHQFSEAGPPSHAGVQERYDHQGRPYGEHWQGGGPSHAIDQRGYEQAPSPVEGQPPPPVHIYPGAPYEGYAAPPSNYGPRAEAPYYSQAAEDSHEEAYGPQGYHNPSATTRRTGSIGA